MLLAGLLFSGCFCAPCTLNFRFGTAVSGSQTVTLELTKNGTVVFTDSRDSVSFTSVEPNGPGCSPSCQQATVTF